MEQHERFAVTHGFSGRVMTRPEVSERKILFPANVIRVFLQRIAPVSHCRTPLCFDEMIG